MQRKGGNLTLASYEDIFSTEESRADAKLEKVQEISLSELYPFKGHPFKVLDEEAMQKNSRKYRTVWRSYTSNSTTKGRRRL